MGKSGRVRACGLGQSWRSRTRESAETGVGLPWGGGWRAELLYEFSNTNVPPELSCPSPSHKPADRGVDTLPHHRFPHRLFTRSLVYILAEDPDK